ncbi:MAG: hypothetical protein H7257_03940, partial [Taibaiella sp.]|nr:hypothetical protein [Taibaiella sp.]
MKKLTLLIFFLLFAQILSAQIISTVITGIYDPYGITMDSNNNLYFVEHLGHKIKMFDNSGVIHAIAGTGINGYNGDG